MHGLDVDYSHAVGRPSSESCSSAHGGACPLQWVPVLLAVVGMPHQPNFTEYVMYQLYLNPQPEVQALIDSGAGMDAFEALCKEDHMKSICAEVAASFMTTFPEDRRALSFGDAFDGQITSNYFGKRQLRHTFDHKSPPPSPPQPPPSPPSPPQPPPSPPSPPSPPQPPSQPSSPPSPPLQPGSRYAFSSSDLRAALNDNAVSRIVLVAGTYEFADEMCPEQRGSALCIDRNVTLEAEVAGSVVLNATGARRVIRVSTAGRAELIGLNITGGAAEQVSFRASIEPTRDLRIAAWIIMFSLYIGWWHPHRRLCRSD